MGKPRKRTASKNLSNVPVITPIGWKTLFRREQSGRSLRLEDIVIETHGVQQNLYPRPIRKIRILKKERTVQFANSVRIR